MDVEPSCSFFSDLDTNSLLTTSQYAKVIFNDVKDRHFLNDDLVCCYTLSEGFNQSEWDRIALYKLGWKQISEYVMFEFAQKSQGSGKYSVTFKANNLPTDCHEFYQFCYVSEDDLVCGASIPFQFVSAEPHSELVNMTDSVQLEDSFENISADDVKPTETGSEDEGRGSAVSKGVDSRVAELQEENESLRKRVAVLEERNTVLAQHGDQIQMLKQLTESLKSLLSITQGEVTDLKKRIQMAGDEYRKLYIEKSQIEKKYDKLNKKIRIRTRSHANGSTACEDIGELATLPPLPILDFNV